MKFELLPGAPRDMAVVQNLGRFYVYDLAAFAGWRCPPDGLYECRDLSSYWGPDGLPFVIRVDGDLAGFALVDRRVGPAVDFAMGEFFVLRQFRRQGVGRQAAHAVFDRLPGSWEVSQILENHPAIAFWRQVIGRYPGASIRETTRWDDQTAQRQNVMTFRISRRRRAPVPASSARRGAG